MKDAHTFLVTVTGCTEEQASQVMAERIDYDEEDPDKFEYGLDRDGPYGEPLYMFTTRDAERVLRRPLVAGESRPIRKMLEGLLGGEVGAIGDEDNPPTLELGASEVAEGQVIREYGMDEWYTITKVGQHGDTMLVSGVTVDGDEEEFTLDIDTVVELLVMGV